MASLNKVMFIGRLTHPPEVRSFSTGGKVAKLRIAVNGRKKNSQTGQWEDVPMYLDCDAFNSEGRKLADLCEQYLAKGHQVYLEGRLELDTWDDKTSGQKRSKHKMVVFDLQFLEPKTGGAAGGGAAGNFGEGEERPARATTPARNNGVARQAAPSYDDGYEHDAPGPSGGGSGDDIPF